MSRCDEDAAVRKLREALERDPLRRADRRALISTLISLGCPEEAAGVSIEGLRRDPGEPWEASFLELGGRLPDEAARARVEKAFESVARASPEIFDRLARWGEEHGQLPWAAHSFIAAIVCGYTKIDYQLWKRICSKLTPGDEWAMRFVLPVVDKLDNGEARANLLAELGSVAASSPEHAFLFEWQAARHARAGEPLDAAKAFVKAIESGHRTADLELWRRILADLDSDQRAAAEERLARVAKRIPGDSAPAYGAWAFALCQASAGAEAAEKRRLLEEAQAVAEQAQRLDSRSPVGYHAQARALALSGAHGQALDWFRWAASRQANDPVLLFDWSLSLGVTGRRRRACKHLREALASRGQTTPAHGGWQPTAGPFDPPTAHLALALNLIALGENDKALRELVATFDDAVRSEASDDLVADCMKEWVSLLARVPPERKEEAVRDLYHHAKAKPDGDGSAFGPGWVGIYATWGEELASRGHDDDALDRFRTAEELAVRDGGPEALGSDPLASWGNLLLKRGETEAAIEKLRRALTKEPDDGSVRTALAKAVARRDTPHDLEAAARLLLLGTRDQGSLDAKCWVDTLDSLQRVDLPGRMRAEAHAFSADGAQRPSTLAAWAQELLARERYGRAITVAKEAARAAGADDDQASAHGQASAQETWGEALRHLGQSEQAIEHLRASADLRPYADLRISLGLALESAGQPEQALEQYRLAAEEDPGSFWSLCSRANLLSNLGRFDEARPVFEEAARADPRLPYAEHNIGAYLDQQGRYAEAREYWHRARKKYEALEIESSEHALGVDRPTFLVYFARVLAGEFQQHDAAELRVRAALALKPDHTGAMSALADLLRERAERSEGRSGAPGWDARAFYQRCRELLKRRIAEGSDLDAWLELGDLHLGAGILSAEDAEGTEPRPGDHAEGCYAHVIDHCPDGRPHVRSDAHNSLGVACMRKGNHDKASRHFEKALRYSPSNPKVMSNLAEAHFKLGQRDRAEKEYSEVLRITEDHVESHIGLGDLFTAMAEDGDKELYEAAIEKFSRGLDVARSKERSKVLKPGELANVLYSRGFARVRSYEASPFLRRKRLAEAREDFELCCDRDRNHLKAKRALARIDERLKSTPADWAQQSGPWVLLPASLLVLVLAQLAFFLWKMLGATHYVAITLGALFFVIVGLYLPQLLRLKVGGLELEKSPVEQVGTAGGLGIKK
jgi:tetratricopeptide (TPR) repeat protein